MTVRGRLRLQRAKLGASSIFGYFTFALLYSTLMVSIPKLFTCTESLRTMSLFSADGLLLGSAGVGGLANGL